MGGGGHQAFTPRSLAAATQASAKPIVSRIAVRQASPSRSGSSGGVAAVGLPSHLSQSENPSTDTSPRISHINSATGIANYEGAPPPCGGGSGTGTCAPRHGGQTA
ncbi:unnamed protein product, partial [Ectocarpus sp. 12 AP-2014]